MRSEHTRRVQGGHGVAARAAARLGINMVAVATIPMKSALVTGCSSGIGLATSIALAKKGYAVYGTMRDPGRDGPLREASAKAGVEVEVVPMDLSVEESIAAAAEKVTGMSGGVDVLVNNAGYGHFGTAEETPVADFRAQFEVNLFGAISLTQKVLPPMRERGSGRIVNMGSVAGRMGLPGSPAYISSKFALEGLTECMRYELSPFSIQTTIIEPGVVKTPFFKSMKVTEPEHPEYQKMMDQIMSGLQMMVNMGTEPDVVAGVVIKALNDTEMLPRYTAGADAAMFIEAKNSRTDMEFERYMKSEVFFR